MFLPPHLRRLAALALLAASAVAFWAALQPKLAPPGAYQADKILHIAVFAVLGGLATLAAGSARALALILLALCGLGGAIELAQSMVPGRTGSAADLAGDVAGLLAGAAALRLAVGALLSPSSR